MNRRALIALGITCLMVLPLSACGTPDGEVRAEFRTAYETAVANSMKADIYYWQETSTRDGETRNREANVYALKDDEGNVLTNEDGTYRNHCIFAADRLEGTEYYAGASPSAENAGHTQNYLLERRKLEDGTTVSTRCPMTAREFYNSDEFKSFRVDTLLAELAELSFDDMDFTGANADFDSKLYMKTMSFTVKPEYLELYQAAHGEPSMFAGSEYVVIEMAYDRISQVVIYEAKREDRFSIDTERYNLKIAYYGPIIQMPSYDAAADGEPVWKDK